MAADPVPGSESTRVLLARHGEVDARHRGTVYGRLDVELSRAGLRQSQALADSLAGLRLDAVVSSGLRRAEAAAALVRASRGLPRVDDPRFVEMDRGEWAGVALAELRRKDPESHRSWVERRGALAGPGGESPDDVARRVVPAIDELSVIHRGGQILIVAHMWVVRSAVCHALGIPMERSPVIGLQPGGLTALDWPTDGGSGRPRLVELGATAVAP